MTRRGLRAPGATRAVRREHCERKQYPTTCLRLALLVLALLPLPAWAQENGGVTAQLLARLGKRDTSVHDPSSIVWCKGQYWLFCTGANLPSFHSKDLMRWESGPPTFPIPPTWTFGIAAANSQPDFWAPEITYAAALHQYRLYYAVSTFGINRSAIGLATNPTLDPADPSYRWTDRGIVVESRQSDDFNAIDPTVLSDGSGRAWLAFGSFWSGIKLAQLDARTGMRLAKGGLSSLAAAQTIEAPYLYEHDGYYYLLVNWGFCCRGVDSTYNIRVGRSRSIAGPYLDKQGTDMRRGGGSLLLGTQGPFIGPGQASILNVRDRYFLACHFYDPTRNGAGTLAIRPLAWTADGWPSVADAPQ